MFQEGEVEALKPLEAAAWKLKAASLPVHPVPKLVTSPAQIPEIDSTSSWKGLHGNIFMERASENMWPYLIYSRVVISHYKTFLIRIFSALSTPFPGVDL